ncbi:MAG: carbohydrate kinase family protein [Verrucomicrobiaceae bacterium]|nr:MAG: carbohydrate kinase family protein [Verrucomicrobiaceae bacterium]
MENQKQSQRSGILAAGNWIVDHVKLIDAFPDQDALSFILSQSKSNGGGPYNVLKDLSMLGADFSLQAAGLVGNDTDGQWIINDCRDSGIDTDRLALTSDATTSYTDAMSVESTGRRTFFHHVGANALLQRADINLSESRAKFFYLGYLLLLESLDKVNDDGRTSASELLNEARSLGFLTVVDLVSAQLGDFKSVVLPSLPEVNILLLNELEAGALLGLVLDENDPAPLISAARQILNLGVRDHVIVHSASGVVAVSSDGNEESQGSVQLPENMIGGAAGAGDAFAAGFIMGLHEEKSISESLQWGACSAASCLTDPTTSGGIFQLGEALKLGEQFGFREF